MGIVSLSTYLLSATGEQFKSDGTSLPTQDSTVAITDLTPGRHSVYLFFNEMDFSDVPKVIEIAKGANYFTWKLPPLIPVDGDLLIEDKVKTKDTLLKLQCYMTIFGQNSRTFSAPIKDTDTGYHLDLFPRYQYTTLLLSNKGYAMVVFDTTKDGKVTPKPLPLLPGGGITTRFVDKDGKDLKVPGKILIIPKTNNRFKPAIPITTDENGIGTLPYVLPPSTWMLCDWGNDIKGYTPLTSEVKIVENATVEMVITLVKAKE
ncbi:MAG: hypothetical protein WCJ56_03110 [bacterium]